MSKNKNRKHLDKGSRQVDNGRGSKLWAFNHFRSPILTSLLNDLVELEHDGLTEAYCSKVLSSLEYFANYATEFPRGGPLTGPIYQQILAFTQTYREWNDIEGQSEDARNRRRRLLRKLRSQRQKITDKARTLQYELENELDRQLLADTYRAIGDLITMGPGLFRNLAGAYGEYLKRGVLPVAQ